MKLTLIKRCFLVLVLANCPCVFGQTDGTKGIHVGLSMPTGMLNTLLNTGKGIGINMNSGYFYQVRSRFSADISSYESSGVGYTTRSYDSNIGQTINSSLNCKFFATLDGGLGLDYKLLPNMIPSFYCGPEMIVGLDFANLYYTGTNYYYGGYVQKFIHTGLRINVGLEKKLGKVEVFGEYSITRMRSENYDYNGQDYYGPTKSVFAKFLNQKICLGIRF